MQPEISQLRQWQKSYITTLFCVSVFQKNSITIKEENLKITSSNNWKNCEKELPRIGNWSEAMSEAYKIANEKSSQSRAKGKKLYDRRIRSSELRSGDRVLVRNKRVNEINLASCEVIGKTR